MRAGKGGVLAASAFQAPAFIEIQLLRDK